MFSLPRPTAELPRWPTRLPQRSILPVPPPRSSSEYDPGPGKTRAETGKEVVECLEKAQREHLRQPPSDAKRSQKQLWVSIDRYKNEAPRGVLEVDHKSVTLLFVHATGFGKHIWEPVLCSLMDQIEVGGSFRVEDIWAFESVNHGDSSIINASALGGICDGNDDARDTLNFLTHYLPRPSCPEPLPLHLQPVPASTYKQRLANGYPDRELLVIGHSFGGTVAILAAASLSMLFSGIILVDPIIESVHPEMSSRLYGNAIRRRSHWSTREEARASFAAHPFFGSWHPDAMTAHTEHGLIIAPDGGVQLKTSSIQEAATFVDFTSLNDAFEALPSLDASIELRWIMPDLRKSWWWHDTSGKGELAQRRVWRRPINTSNIFIEGVGHMIPQEVPSIVAEEIYQFMLRRYSRNSTLQTIARL